MSRKMKYKQQLKMMKGASGIDRSIYFEDFELDLDRGLLLRGGEELQLRRQSFEVLRYLAERSGDLVTKDELLSDVWAGRAVTDDSITQCLMEIRAALGDENHSKVKTLPRRGYLFDLPVSDTEPGFRSDTTFSAFINSRKSGFALVVAGLVTVLVIGFMIWRPGFSPPASQLSLAVLPFDNRSNREEDQFFTVGMHDDLLATIAKIGSMKVISRTSVLEYKDTVKKIPQIAKELGVANILEGGIQRSGNQVRINVQLIDAASDEHLWAEIYDRELTAENLFAVQSEIAKMIANALQAKLSAKEKQRIDAKPTDNLQAYDAYIRGRQLMATRDSANLKLATEEFGKATRIDPLFALAWVGVADSNMLLSGYGSDHIEDLLPIIEEAVKNALAIDNDLGEAYASLANIHAYHKRKDEAETAYQKAIALSPNYASAYVWYSSYLGVYPLRIKEQVDLARKAVELDPRSSLNSLNLGGRYRNQGLYTLAEGQFQKVIELNPDFAPGYSSLAILYMLHMGQFDKALSPARKAVELDPGNHGIKMILVFLYLQLNDLDAAHKVREEMAKLGAAEWRLDFADVLINFGKSLSTQNPTDTLESIIRLLPKIKNFQFENNLVAFLALTQGDIQLSREIFLSTDPGWLEPAQWPELVENHRKDACYVAWVLINTGDQDLGSALLREAISYIDDSLPLAIEHSDWDFPEVCYLIAGDTEKSLLSVETQLAHNHLYAWNAVHLLPMYDLIRDEPRFQAAVAERERRIAIQRKAIAAMGAETQP